MRARWLAPAVLALALAAAALAADPVEEFLRRHWARPLAPQGAAPARWTPVEQSLAPEACGTCHPAQLADWRTSLHARTMGPGVAGQLVEMLRSDPESALGCLACHAPLAEQAPLVLEGGAACHVRGHARFGPPRRAGALERAAPGASLPHGGATRTPAFLRAEFCRSCHQ